jgi:uncharacterized membrane protein YedE/YeeE
MTWNSIITSLAGGALIGIGVSVLLLFNGRVAGVVGIVSGLLRPSPNEWGWKAAFVLGLLAGGTAFSIASPSAIAPAHGSLALIALGGLAVGLGARIGGGCTAGHGICGLSRFSRRSLVATMTFMATGMVTGGVVHLVGVVR